MRKEPGNERSVQRGCLNAVKQFGRDRDAGDHVLEDQSLVLKLLPLSCSERKPVSCAHCFFQWRVENGEMNVEDGF